MQAKLKADPTQTHLAQSHKHGSPLISCRFHPAGKFVFFGAEDGSVWRWEIGTDRKAEYAHDSWVRGLGVLNAKDLLLTGGYDGRLIWWPAGGDSLAAVRTVQAHQGWVRGVAVSSNASRVATVGNDLLVKIWGSDDGRLLRTLSGHERPVYHAAFHPDGNQLATGDLMGNLFHWNLETGKLQRKWKLEALHKYDKTFKADIGGFRDLRFSDDGKRLLCAGITNVTNAFAGVGNPIVIVWDWESGKQEIAHVAKTKVQGVAWGAAFHPQGFLAGAAGGSGGAMLFWKPGQAEAFHQLKLPNNARDLDLSPDGLHVATAHHDGVLRLYRMAPKA